MFEPVPDVSLPECLSLSNTLIWLPKGSSCKVNIPVYNSGNSDIMLHRKTMLGHLVLVDSLTPVEREKQAPVCVESINPELVKSVHEKWDPPIDISHLSESQQNVVREMLREESAAFSQNDSDFGCIPNLKMNIKLTDNNPVHRAYSAIPRPLFGEVKAYLQDLLSRGWISKSHSPYASPVVCVRKKCGGLRLCVDYRELNQKDCP